MDKLSVEILSSIFTYLHYEQKKQCMLVCQSWAQVIKSSGLKLETIMNPEVVSSYTSQPTLASIQSNTDTVGCHRLALDQYHNKAKLAKLFPNMRFLVFYPGQEVSTHPSYTVHASGVVPVEYTDEETELLACWHHRLETLIDYDFTNELFVFLNSGVFHQLTTLMVQPDWNFPRDIRKADIFFECLKNTPNLKLIDLKAIGFNITHLEKLHSYAPYLETLRCDYIAHTTEESLEINSKATSLKTLEMGHTYHFPTVLARYILEKYPNLQEFNCTNSHYNNELKPFLPQFLQATETTMTKLKIHAPKIVSSITTCLQENPYLSLKALEIMICDNPPDPRRRIGYRGQEIVVRPLRVSEQGEDSEEKEKEIFDLVKWVENSNITSLSLINIPNINLGVFNTLDKLKDLKLKFLVSLRVSAELNSVITELPKSLESLSLSNVDVYLKEEEEEEEKKDWQIISGIKRLELLGCRANSDLSDYLSNQLPQLKTFIHHTDRLLFDLRLRHSHLSLVDIARDFRNPATIEELLAPKEDVPHKHIKVTMGNKTRKFRHSVSPRVITLKSRLRFREGLFNAHDHSLHDVFIPFEPVIENIPCFHFQCESIQTLFYDRSLVLV